MLGGARRGAKGALAGLKGSTDTTSGGGDKASGGGVGKGAAARDEVASKGPSGRGGLLDLGVLYPEAADGIKPGKPRPSLAQVLLPPQILPNVGRLKAKGSEGGGGGEW